MKISGRLAAVAALAAGAMFSTSAMANAICSGCGFGGAGGGSIYIGSYDPTLSNFSAGVNHSDINTAVTPTASNPAGLLNDGSLVDFNDAFFFDINPAGLAEIQGSFTPSTGVSLFAASVWSVTAGTCSGYVAPGLLNSPPATPGSCTGVTYGAQVAPISVIGGYFLTLPFTDLSPAGLYAVRVSGKAKQLGITNGYSFNLTTTVAQVPEPASLALVGLALVGLGVSVRRRKAL